MRSLSVTMAAAVQERPAFSADGAGGPSSGSLMSTNRSRMTAMTGSGSIRETYNDDFPEAIEAILAICSTPHKLKTGGAGSGRLRGGGSFRSPVRLPPDARDAKYRPHRRIVSPPASARRPDQRRPADENRLCGRCQHL